MPNLTELNRYVLDQNDVALNAKVYINRITTTVPPPIQNDFGSLVAVSRGATTPFNIQIDIPLSAASSFKIETAVDASSGAVRRYYATVTEQVVSNLKRFTVTAFDATGVSPSPSQLPVTVKITGYI